MMVLYEFFPMECTFNISFFVNQMHQGGVSLRDKAVSIEPTFLPAAFQFEQ